MENQQTVITKVTALAKNKFGGDLKKMFLFYAPSGNADKPAVDKLLEDAGVGYAISRQMWIDNAVIAAFDKNGDGMINLPEFCELLGIPST